MTTREAALQALVARIASSVPMARVERNIDFPPAVPAAGLIIVRDGQPQFEDQLLGGAPSFITHVADVEVYATGATRDDTFDDLLAAIGVAIATDRTLGGTVAFADVRTDQQQLIVDEGAPTVKAALVAATFEYQAAHPLD